MCNFILMYIIKIKMGDFNVDCFYIQYRGYFRHVANMKISINSEYFQVINTFLEGSSLW